MKIWKLLVMGLVAFSSLTAVAEEMDSISRDITEGKIVAAQIMNLEYDYQEIVKITENIGINSTKDSTVMTSASQLELEASWILEAVSADDSQGVLDQATKRMGEIKNSLLQIQNQLK